MVFLAKTPLVTYGHLFAAALIFLDWGADRCSQSREGSDTARKKSNTSRPLDFGCSILASKIWGRKRLDSLTFPAKSSHPYSQPSFFFLWVLQQIFRELKTPEPSLWLFFIWLWGMEWPPFNWRIYDTLPKKNMVIVPLGYVKEPERVYSYIIYIS